MKCIESEDLKLLEKLVDFCGGIHELKMAIHRAQQETGEQNPNLTNVVLAAMRNTEDRR